jgi:L-galactose dehydrogenase
VEYRTLGKTGLRVSIIGYGASPLGNEFGETDVAEGIRAVHHAIERGINYFDVSPYYGRTLAEERLGAALQGKRDKVLLATKCGRYGREVEECDYSAKRVTAGVDGSLKRLRTDHVDVIQIHDCEMAADPEQLIRETLPALRKIVKAGKARWVGITGLPLKLLRYLATEAEVDTILSFCRYNLMITDMDEVLTPLCRRKEIGLINASPLHMRMLTEKGVPEWHPAPKEVLDVSRQVVSACREAGLDVADVAFRFCLDHPGVATTLVGMSKQRHVESNLRALERKNDPALLKRLAGIIAPVKNVMWTQGRPENNDPNWVERR